MRWDDTRDKWHFVPRSSEVEAESAPLKLMEDDLAFDAFEESYVVRVVRIMSRVAL